MTEQEAQKDAVELAHDIAEAISKRLTAQKVFGFSPNEINQIIIGRLDRLPSLLMAEAERDELSKEREEFRESYYSACETATQLRAELATVKADHAALLAVAVISESLVWLRSVKTEPTATVEALREALSALPKGLLEAERREA